MFLSDFNEEQLNNLLSSFNEPKFRARQLFLSAHSFKSFDEMTNIPKSLKEKLKDNDIWDLPVKIIKTLESKDGTKKFLFALKDGNVIEGVLMKYKYGYTQCVSTQVGCRMHCAFCASGLHGLIRNLSSGEILGQILAVNSLLNGGLGDKRQITNVVLMGSGEPLDNYDNVVAFLNNVSNPDGINISPRNISLSTCGLVPNIYKLSKEGLPVNLTISLHSPFDEERKQIMPIANAYSIKEILNACHEYFKVTGRRYIFEYVLINGKTNLKRHADELIKLLKGKTCHVNLIRLNAVSENDLEAVSEADAYFFLGLLSKGGISATLRRQMGVDIDGACGQLRQKYLEENDL